MTTIKQALQSAGYPMGQGSTPQLQCEPDCPVCLDQGVVTFDVPFSHPLFSKPQPCPASCKASQERQARIARNIMARARMDVGNEYTFDSFYDLGTTALTGKLHALGCAICWVKQELGGFTMTQAARMVGNQTWATKQDKHAISLVLFGQPGRGKTGLASAAVNALVGAGQACHFTRADDFFQLMTDRYSSDEARHEADKVREMMGRIPYLVLDEVSQEEPSQAKRDTLDALLRRRDNNGLPTLMTTNFDKKAFRNAWGMRAGSIAAKAHWVELAGMELRTTFDVVGEVF